MDSNKRTQAIRKFLDKNSPGLEIGASISPIAPKSAGFMVKNLDHTDKKGLVEKFSGMSAVPEWQVQNIEEVDYVWSGERYTDLIPERKEFSWILGSHVGEHFVSLLNFLEDSEQLLKDDGKMVLILPDKRYTFDYFREVTSIREVIDQYMRDDWSTHTLGTCFDQGAILLSSGSWQIGELVYPEEVSLRYHDEDFPGVLDRCKKSMVSKSYIDMHNTVMTPHSFDLIIKYLNAFNYINLDVTRLSKLADHEFLVILEKKSLSQKGLRDKLPDLFSSLIADRLEADKNFVRLPLKLNIASKFFSSLHVEGFLLKDKASAISNIDIDCIGLKKVASKSSFLNSKSFVIDALFNSDKFSIDSCHLIYSTKNSNTFNSLPVRGVLVDYNKSVLDLHGEIRRTATSLIEKNTNNHTKVKSLYISENTTDNLHYKVLEEFDQKDVENRIVNYNDFISLDSKIVGNYDVIYSYDILDSLPFNTEKVLCKASELISKENGSLVFAANPLFNGLGYVQDSWDTYAKPCNLTVKQVTNGQHGYSVPLYNYKDSPAVVVEQSLVIMTPLESNPMNIEGASVDGLDVAEDL